MTDRQLLTILLLTVCLPIAIALLSGHLDAGEVADPFPNHPESADFDLYLDYLRHQSHTRANMLQFPGRVTSPAEPAQVPDQWTRLKSSSSPSSSSAAPSASLGGARVEASSLRLTDPAKGDTA